MERELADQRDEGELAPPPDESQYLPPFREFLADWVFRNRETGATSTFGHLWPGQEELAGLMATYQWLFALKAGKLGFTELECAFDAYRAISQRNALVGLISKDQVASRALMSYVVFGLSRLPTRYGVSVVGQNLDAIIFRVNSDPDDRRLIRAFPATGSIAIDLSLTHAHVDELSQVSGAAALWNSVITTVAPEGSCHIITRGAGDAVYTAELWEAATSAAPELRGFKKVLFPYFAPFDMRPDRTEATRRAEESSGSYTQLGLSYFLPRTPEEALAGDEASPYIPLERWDTLYEKDLPPLLPGSREAVILALDAAVTADCFGIVAVTRHPDPTRYASDIAIRRVKKWTPDMFPNHRIDFATCEEFIRFVCRGGCFAGHPPPSKELAASGQAYHPECEFCQRGEWKAVPGHNVVQTTYDPYQLEDMAQRLRKDGVAWMSEFDQGSERLIGDGILYRLAFSGKLAHNNDPDLREHIGNAKARLQPEEESKMRIIKKSPARKIDLAVAAAMAAKRCLDLNL